MAPKPEKSESASISCKHGMKGLHSKNIWSVPTFFGSGPIFFCGVSGAYVTRKYSQNILIRATGCV